MLDIFIGVWKWVENFESHLNEKIHFFSWKYEKIPTNPQIQKMSDSSQKNEFFRSNESKFFCALSNTNEGF